MAVSAKEVRIPGPSGPSFFGFVQFIVSISCAKENTFCISFIFFAKISFLQNECLFAKIILFAKGVSFAKNCFFLCERYFLPKPKPKTMPKNEGRAGGVLESLR